MATSDNDSTSGTTPSVMGPAGSALANVSKSSVGRQVRIGMVVGLVLLVGIIYLGKSMKPRAVELPVLGTVPAFALTDEQGKPFTEKSLEGKVWAANFIFSRCPSICPRFSEKMAKLERGLSNEDDARFVSLTVDPEFDTPERLAAYAKRYGAEPGRWSFLTGSREALEALIIRGMNVHMTKDEKRDDAAAVQAAGGETAEGADDIMSIGHGGHFALVDEQLRIRGYYDSADADAVARLSQDMKSLLND